MDALALPFAPMPARKGQTVAPRHALLVPLAVREDGTTVTVTERVASAIRLGASMRTAAARAGASSATVQAWLRSGNRLAAGIAAGARLRSDLTATERAEVEFAVAVEAASAAHELALLTQLEALSQPRQERTITVRIDADGKEIDRTERTEDVAPEGQTIRWRLERRHPDTWGPRQAVEHTGTVGVTVDVAERAAELVAQLRGGGGQPGGG